MVRMVRHGDELTLPGEIVLGLEQAVGVTMAEQKRQGQVLRTPPDLAAAKRDTRLVVQAAALAGRLDAHAGAVTCVEAGFGRSGAAAERAGQIG